MRTVTYDEPYIKEQPQVVVNNGLPTPEERRQQRLRDMSVRLNNPQTINELENQPAYMRRNVALDDVPSSADHTMSKWAVNNDNEERPEIRESNSFLHDNVD